jgi:hypothetical protein
MTSQRTPPRLTPVETPSDPLALALRAARREEPTPAAMARMREGLTAALLESAQPRTSDRSTQSAAGKLLLLGAGLVAFGVVVALWPASTPPPASQWNKAAPEQSVPAAEQPVATPQGIGAGGDAAVVVTVEQRVPNVAKPAAPRRRAATASVSAIRPEALAAPSELELLRAAQSALQTAPVTALAHLSEHRRLYAHGILCEERDVLEIEALIAARRIQDAHALAASFEVQHPSSAHLRRIKRLFARSEQGAGHDGREN